MAQLLVLNVNVEKIDKKRLYKGKKGTYLNLMVEVMDKDDEFGKNVRCWEGQTEEERKEKATRNFLGAGKKLWEKEEKKEEEDDLPF